MGFKEDADFARFVSMGAIGAAAVADHLRTEHGHIPVELERYAMANKVWQTKIKRLRLPDLICVACGLRVESRAKSKLGIILSHSEVEGRAWDAAGMRASDVYAFLRADFPMGRTPYTSIPYYFSTQALRNSLVSAKRSSRSAASEGSEITLTWPCWVPGQSGTFIEKDNQNRIVCQWLNGNTYRYQHWLKWAEPRYLYVEPGSSIYAGESIVVGIVSPLDSLDCPGNIWDIKAALASPDEIERYAGVKSSGLLKMTELQLDLKNIAESEPDWRLKLEALGSLAQIEPNNWVANIIDFAWCDVAEQQMESVFILSEVGTNQSVALLAELALNTTIASEIRAAAAWGLGQGPLPRPDLLLPIVLDTDEFVALHAISAIQSIPDDVVPILINWMGQNDDRQAAVAAHLLLRHEQVDALLGACDLGEPFRLWALRALGDLPPSLVQSHGSKRLTNSMLDSLRPLWQGQNDWLRNQGREGLEALEVQKIRFDPSYPSLA